MTRSRHVTQAAGTNEASGRRTCRVRPASMEFLVLEDNGGAFHWAIVAASGERLVQSASFASYEEAKQAAGIVRPGAGVSAVRGPRGRQPRRSNSPPAAETASGAETIWMQSVGWMNAAASTARR